VSARPKYLCTECAWAAKGRCPQHPGASLMMGRNWRSGKKGKRTRLWDNRVHGSQTVPPPTVRLGAWPSRYRDGTGPFRVAGRPPLGLVVLGATDFSRDQADSSWSDPVRAAIRSRNQKPPRPLELPSGDPGWPFPFDWETLQSLPPAGPEGKRRLDAWIAAGRPRR